MPEQTIPFKVFSLTLVLALSLSGMTFSLNTKGQVHGILGRLSYGAFGFAGLAGLFWALPLGEEFVSLSVLLMLYLTALSLAWARPNGPVRLDRAITGMALMASIATVFTAISVWLGFRAETLTLSGAPMAFGFGLCGAEIARQNMAWLDQPQDQIRRHYFHALHAIGAFCALSANFGYVMGIKLEIDPFISAAACFVPGALTLIWRSRRA